MRGPRDPVRRAFSVEHKCLWNTGSPAFAGDDGLGDDTPSRSRGALRPRFCYLFSFTLQSEGAGNGRAPMRRGKNARVVATVTPEHPAFPAQWFIRLLRAHPGDRALLPPSPARRSAGLTPASRCQVDTTWPSAASMSVSRAATSHHSPSHVRDVRETPLRIGTGCRRYRLICYF